MAPNPSDERAAPEGAGTSEPWPGPLEELVLALEATPGAWVRPGWDGARTAKAIRAALGVAVDGARPSPAVVGEPAPDYGLLLCELMENEMLGYATDSMDPELLERWQDACEHYIESTAVRVESPLVFPDAGERGEPDVHLTERSGEKPEAADGEPA